MVNNLGIKLNKLVKERTYLGGTLLRLQNKAEELRVEYKATRVAVKKANVRWAELGSEIEKLSALDLEDIRKIKETPRKTDQLHGALTREFIRVLKSIDGPITTGELVQYIVKLYGYPYNTQAERRATRNAVICPLNIFSKRGVVIRLPALEGSKQGRWQWVHYTADNEP